jgi:hypothetical protein
MLILCGNSSISFELRSQSQRSRWHSADVGSATFFTQDSATVSLPVQQQGEELPSYSIATREEPWADMTVADHVCTELYRDGAAGRG